MGTISKKIRIGKKIAYWLVIALGIYIVPKSYREWTATEEKLKQISQGEDIEGFDTEQRYEITEENIQRWLSNAKEKNNAATFCPPVSDRKFWNVQNSPSRLSPKDAQILGPLPPIIVLNEGTKQECFYNTGEWIPEIEKALTELLKIPWGDKDPNGKYFVDLKATTTAREMAHCISMLESKLPPGLVIQVKKEIRKRIVDPYRKELNRYQTAQGYFGATQCPWLGGRWPSNWIAVCVSNIVYCSMVVDSVEEQAEIIVKSKEPIEDYLKTFEDDGYIPAGIRYWNYGFQHLLFLAELLYSKTDGNVNLFKNPKLAQMVTFPFSALVGKNENQDFEFYPLFADNKNPTRTDDWTWEIIKQRFEIPEEHILLQSRYLPPEDGDGAIMDLLVYKSANPNNEKIPVKIKEESSHFYPNNGVLISRFNNGKEVVTIAGGNNGTEHNHNDIGSYTFFSKNNVNYWLPVFGDMGDLEYTQENFARATRYLVDILSSYGHPVPVVNGQLQFTSAKAQSKLLKHSLSKKEDSITYDLSTAYDVPEIESLTRTAIVKKEQEELNIIDSFKSQSPIEFESPIITSILPKEPYHNPKSDITTFEFEITGEKFKAEILNSSTLNINITPLKAKNFDYNPNSTIKSEPHRINLKLKEKQLEGTISYRLSKVKAQNRPIEFKAIPPRKEDSPKKRD